MKKLKEELKNKRSVSGVKKAFENNHFTVLGRTGGDYTLFTDGARCFSVKVVRNEEDRVEYPSEDYDVYIVLNGKEVMSIEVNEDNF